MTDAAKVLMQVASPESRARIRKELDGLHQDWIQMMEEIEEKQQHLEGVLQKWSEVEDGMEDMLQWLKEVRQVLSHDLPDNFDELQKEQQLCRVSGKYLPL